MSEPIPVLPYRKSAYVRRPIFAVLAILLIVFGAVSIFVLALSILEMHNQLKAGPLKNLWILVANAIATSSLSIVSMICLMAAGTAFLTRSKHVGILLQGYFLVTLCSALLSPALQQWIRLGAGLNPNDMIGSALHSVVGLPRAIPDALVLMLLGTPAVKEIIRNVTGIENPLK